MRDSGIGIFLVFIIDEIVALIFISDIILLKLFQ